jgi:hypothetical protein
MSGKNVSLITRRDALHGFAMAGGCGLALMASEILHASTSQSLDGDLSILLAALYLEHEAIAAYEAGAGATTLPVDIVTAALAFQSDHKYHRDGIIETVQKLGGTPIDAKEKYSFGPLKNLRDVLKLARKLEQGAVDAYASLASNIQNRAVLDFAAHVLADEVRHVTVLAAVSSNY